MGSSGARHLALWREGKSSLPMPREEEEEQASPRVSEQFWLHSERGATGHIGPQDDSYELPTLAAIRSASVPISEEQHAQMLRRPLASRSQLLRTERVDPHLPWHPPGRGSC